MTDEAGSPVTGGTPKDAGPDPVEGFFETARGAVLSSVPALLALTFIVVAVKVFRASYMESTTTVAIVSTADEVALLKGVVLTLLPGFLAGLTAAAIWWWAGILPTNLAGTGSQEAARRALLSPQAVWAWVMMVVAFFTIWWPVFLVLFVPVLAATAALVPVSLGASRPLETMSTRRKVVVYGLVPAGVAIVLLAAKAVFGFSWAAFVVALVPFVVVPEAVLFGLRPPQKLTAIPLRRALRAFGLVSAAVFIGLLTLLPSVWLPLRTITFTGTPPVLKGQQLPHQVAAYVLTRDEKGASLLLSRPRAVLQVGPDAIELEMPLCVPPESKLRSLTIRASQAVGVDADPHTPYEQCPEIPQRLLGGG